MADPELAWREILKMMIDPAVTEKTIRVGNAPYDVGSMTTVTNPVNYFVVQALPLTYVLGLSAPQLVVSNGTYVVGDRLLIDKEVMSVTSITTSTNGLPPGVTNLTLFVDRSQYYGSVQQQHFPGALIRRLNPDILANVYPYASQSNLVSRLEAVKKELQIELGKNLTFKPVPVLFRRLPDPRTGEPLYTATTANMVNSVFDPFPAPGRIYSASPGNARFETLFSGAAGRPVVFTRDEDDRLAWDNYHVWVGSLHCGSNGKRVPPTKLSPPAKVWWEYQEFEHWGK